MRYSPDMTSDDMRQALLAVEDLRVELGQKLRRLEEEVYALRRRLEIHVREHGV